MMKVCETCGEEIGGRDCDTQCPDCESKERKNASRRLARQFRDEMMRDMGLVKVHGILGGTYWE